MGRERKERDVGLHLEYGWREESSDGSEMGVYLFLYEYSEAGKQASGTTSRPSSPLSFLATFPHEGRVSPSPHGVNLPSPLLSSRAQKKGMGESRTSWTET